jgi:hypothetical protein
LGRLHTRMLAVEVVHHDRKVAVAAAERCM